MLFLYFVYSFAWVALYVVLLRTFERTQKQNGPKKRRIEKKMCSVSIIDGSTFHFVCVRVFFFFLFFFHVVFALVFGVVVAGRCSLCWRRCQTFRCWRVVVVLFSGRRFLWYILNCIIIHLAYFRNLYVFLFFFFLVHPIRCASQEPPFFRFAKRASVVGDVTTHNSKFVVIIMIIDCKHTHSHSVHPKKEKKKWEIIHSKHRTDTERSEKRETNAG